MKCWYRSSGSSPKGLKLVLIWVELLSDWEGAFSAWSLELLVTLRRSLLGVDAVGTGRCTAVSIESKHRFWSNQKIKWGLLFANCKAMPNCEFLGTSFKHLFWRFRQNWAVAIPTLFRLTNLMPKIYMNCLPACSSY